MNSDHWTSFSHSIFSIGGTFLSILILIFFFSIVSRILNRFPRIKLKFQTSILPDAEGSLKIHAKTVPVILQINIQGIIGQDDLDITSIDTQLVESQMGSLYKNRVKGILLKINSPGGSAVDSDGIYRKIKTYKEKYKIPIYAHVEGYCASGGMFIACAADKIFAAPSSVIGSVGVRCAWPFLNIHKVLQRWDIGSKTLAMGKHKDHLNPFRPWEEGEDSDLQNVLLESYNRFVDVVVQERTEITRELLVEEYGAQIYSASEASKLGFIDGGASDYMQILSALTQASQIHKGQPYQVIEFIKKKSVLKELLANSPLLGGKIKHEIQLGSYSMPKISGIVYLPPFLI